MNEELRRLTAENAALRRGLVAADREAARAPAAENARLRVLLGDVHTALLAAGWQDDALVQQLRAEAACPGPGGHRLKLVRAEGGPA